MTDAAERDVAAQLEGAADPREQLALFEELRHPANRHHARLVYGRR